jgi:hypothetical protein
VFSLKPDQFAFALFGQSIVAISQIFVLAVPIRLAKIWFSPEQVKVEDFFEVDSKIWTLFRCLWFVLSVYQVAN